MSALRATLCQRLRAELEHTRPVYKNGPGRIVVYRNEGPTPAPDSDAAIPWAMGHAPEGWPEGLPLPLTAADALAAFEDGIDAMAEEIAADIRHAAKLLVRPELVKAALLRKDLADRWPFAAPPLSAEERASRSKTAWAGWKARRSLGGLNAGTRYIHNARPGVDGETQAREWFRGWPAAAAPAAVAAWARDALNGLRPGMGDALADNDDAGQIVALFLVLDDAGVARSIPAGGIALLFLVEQEIDTSAHRPAVRHDANVENHMLVRAMSAERREVQDSFGLHAETETLYLTLPGRRTATQLTLAGIDSLSSPLVDAVVDIAGPEGLRHWAAFQEVLSEQGSTGEMRWDLDQHLTAMGYTPKERTRADTRRKAAELARLFTKLVLRIEQTDSNGRARVRENRPLLLVLGESEVADNDDAWITNAFDLGINPTLYRGVRDQRTNRLGVNHGLAPYGLARLGHRRDKHALLLGMNLAIRFRLAANDDRGWAHVTGAKWLETAGISFDRRKPGRAWDALEAALDRLQGIDAIGLWEWEREPRTLAGVLRAWSPDWIRDRLIGGVRPVERPPVVVRTGTDLREYREARGLTQAATAELLGVSRSTILRAESGGAGPLSRAVLKQIHRLR